MEGRDSTYAVLQKLTRGMIAVIGFSTAVYFIYTAWFGSYPALIQRSVLLGGSLSLVFLSFADRLCGGEKPKTLLIALLLCAVALSFVTTGFVIVQFEAIAESAGFYGQTEVVLGTILMGVLLWATWIAFGPALPLIAVAFLLYAVFGRSMPDVISHRGLSWSSLVAGNYLTTKGILGIALGVVADVVIYFLIFSTFLAATGASETFVRLSQLLVGRMRGGPAKIAVVGSALLGSISGSAVANVAASGTFTIPLMKRTGYTPRLAGAIEAVASSGSQLMPPVMGAAVFVMADMLQMNYGIIISAALFPALIYYGNLFLVVDLEAGRLGLKGLDPFERENRGELLKESIYLLLPLAVLFGLVMMQYSPRYAALMSLAALLVLNLFNPRHRLNPLQLAKTLVEGMVSSAPIAVAVAVAGVVVGVVEVTGLGLNLTMIMTQIAENSILLLLILTMVSSIILGMGLPTVACYIILALILAPVMIRLGISPIAAHMFVFYFGTLSAITPPVALASFTAAGIAGAPPLQTSVVSLRIALPAFLLPYIFVFQPGLLFDGDVAALLPALAIAGLSVVGLAASTVGYFRGRVGPARRVLFFVGGILAFAPDYRLTLIGAALIAVAISLGEISNARRLRVSEQLRS